MADELVELADADCIGPDGRPDNALVQQHRLQVDTWKWLLSKMLPKRFGDRVTTEIAGSAAAPLITRMRGNADGPPRPSAAFQPAFASPFRRGARLPARRHDELAPRQLRHRPGSAASSMTQWLSISSIPLATGFVARWCIGFRVEAVDGSFRLREMIHDLPPDADAQNSVVSGCALQHA